MDTPIAAAEKPLDHTVRRIARFLDRAVALLVVLLMPIALGRLPHYLEAGFFVMACAGLALLFTLAVKLAQSMGYIGRDALQSPPKPDVFEDLSVPVFKQAPPIADSIAATPMLERCHADEVSSRHTISVPGRGRIVYWSDERRD